MNDPVLILYLEDDPRDAELVRDKLQQSSMACELRVASDRAEYEAALAETRFDLILSDYRLPDYDGMAALALARAKQPDVPFILISGTLGEEKAVDCVLHGATDYVLKQRLDRLVPAVLRALAEAEEHQQRREAEAALRESEERHRVILQTAMDGIWLADMQGRLLEVNESYCRMSGYSAPELLAMRIPDLEANETAADTAARIQTIMAQGEHRFESRHRRKDGTVLDVEVSVQYRPAEGGSMVAFLHDITARKQAEERIRMFSHEILAAREEERKRVSADLHHDVGSLAVGMAAYFALIAKAIRSGQAGEALEFTTAAGTLLSQSVARLKEVAVELRPPELDILGLCDAMREHFSRITAATGLRIHFTETLGQKRPAGNVATVLFRIVQEALTNAIRHGRAKEADVSLRASKETIRLTIRDNGTGFNAAEQRARKTPQMGLKVMREMATSAGGSVEIDSAPGKETTVRVSLPLETAASEPGNVTGREKTAARGRTTRPSGRGARPQKRSRT